MQNDTTVVSNNGGTLASSSGGYRMPLVWIDLEMTGKLFSYHNLFYVISTSENLFLMLYFHLLVYS